MEIFSKGPFSIEKKTSSNCFKHLLFKYVAIFFLLHCLQEWKIPCQLLLCTPRHVWMYQCVHTNAICSASKSQEIFCDTMKITTCSNQLEHSNLYRFDRNSTIYQINPVEFVSPFNWELRDKKKSSFELPEMARKLVKHNFLEFSPTTPPSPNKMGKKI